MASMDSVLAPGSAERPTCLCGREMRLAKIEPHLTASDTELRTFQCPRCSHELRLMIWTSFPGA
jgi:DNA-directed RNA polymerase subunit RPC12/RpoP